MTTKKVEKPDLQREIRVVITLQRGYIRIYVIFAKRDLSNFRAKKTSTQQQLLQGQQNRSRKQQKQKIQNYMPKSKTLI